MKYLKKYNIFESKSEKIRISCASLASIKIDDKYLLCLNKSQLKRGDRVLTPFGGALEYKPSALDFLNTLKPEFERETPDLRIFTDISNLQDFENWFNKKEDREVGIDRELIEEMVDEEKILDELNGNDFKSEFIECVKNNTIYNDIMNYRFFEIYNVTFNDDIISKIKSLISETSNIQLVTKEEILLGKTTDGIEIGSNSKDILN